jgi:hypothetical protein
LEQQNRWNDEEKIRKAWAKEIVDAIQRIGVKPDRAVVDKIAAKVIAHRSKMGTRKGNEMFQGNA